MAWNATIGGVPVSLLYGTLAVDETTNGRNTARARVMGTTRFVKNSEFLVDIGGVRRYGGTIVSLSEMSQIENGSHIGEFFQDIECDDFNGYASRRFVRLTIPAGNVKQALQAVLPYVSPFGVTLDPAQVNGSSLPELKYEYTRLDSVLSDIAKLAVPQFIWEIDYLKVLRAFDPTTRPAPFNVVDGDGNALEDIIVEPTQTDYANTIIYRFNDAPQFAYAFLSRPSGNFANGDTVTLGSVTYTFKSGSVTAANDVLIGASSIASLTNLVAAIEDSGGAGSTYGSGTVPNTQATAYVFSGNAIRAQARQVGAAGNNIAATTTSPGVTWYGEGSSPLTSLARGADAALTNFVVATASSGVITADGGPWEKVVEDSRVLDPAVAQLLANAELAQSQASPKRVKYKTRRIGLHSGQVQTITAAARNFSGSCMITEMRLRHVQGDEFRMEIVATEGSIYVGSWRDTIRAWSGEGSQSAQLGAAVSFVTTNVTGRGARSLGGDSAIWVQSTVPTWVPSSGVRVVIDTALWGGTDATVHVRLRASAGTVQARLQNVTDNTTAGSSSVVGTTSFTDLNFTVTLTAGVKTYELQLLPSLANTDVSAIGEIE